MDANFLAAIAKPVTEALRRCQANTFSVAAPATARGGPAVLMLSPELDVRAQTIETDDYLRTPRATRCEPPADPSRRLQRGGAIALRRIRCRRPSADHTRPSGGGSVGHPSGVTNRHRAARGRQGHRGHHRGKHARGADDPVRSRMRAERPGTGTVRRISSRVRIRMPSRGRCSFPRTPCRITSSRSSSRPGRATVEPCWLEAWAGKQICHRPLSSFRRIRRQRE